MATMPIDQMELQMNQPANPWDTVPDVAPTDPPALEIVPEKKKRVKKPKVMKQVKRRPLSAKKAKKFFASLTTPVKLVWETADKNGGNPAYIVQFPADKADMYKPLLEAIPSAAFMNEQTIDPTGTAKYKPEDVVFVHRWRIHASDETLQAIVAFGRKHKFDFEGDMIVRAQMSNADGKRLLAMSSAKSCSTLKLPRFPKVKEGRKLVQLKPLKFQPAGVAYALEAKKTFIADEMGLGKTIQAIITAMIAKKFPILCVVPNTVKFNWKDECDKWFGKKRKSIVLRNKDLKQLRPRRKKGQQLELMYSEKQISRLVKKGLATLQEYDIIIVNYDKVKKWARYFKALQPQFVIFDESHYLKGNSARSRVCMDMMETIDPEYILMLTGTPVLNKPIELIRQLQILGRMKEFGGVSYFMNRYCSIVNVDMAALPPLPKPDENGVMPEITNEQRLALEMHNELIRKVFENQVELNHRLRSICYVRREKSDVLADLPDKVRQMHVFELSNREEYERIESDVIGYLGERAAKDAKFLKSIKKKSKTEQIRLIKEHRAAKEYKAARAEALVRIEVLKQAAAIGKLDSVKEWVEDFFEQNPKRKLVIFANHKVIVNELEAMFPDFSITVRKGEEASMSAKKFQTDKKLKLFITSLKVGGVGITLTAASDVAFVELGWTPAVHDQAEDRCHRITQKNNVTAHYLLAEDTIEQKIARLIENKRQVVDATSFGDPLQKIMQTGSILGELVADLIGKQTTL